MKIMNLWETDMNDNNDNIYTDDFIDNFSENLEYLSRITPTSLPEWMD